MIESASTTDQQTAIVRLRCSVQSCRRVAIAIPPDATVFGAGVNVDWRHLMKKPSIIAALATFAICSAPLAAMAQTVSASGSVGVDLGGIVGSVGSTLSGLLGSVTGVLGGLGL
jgi:ABC-type taurine transport system substrate-binding protein